MDKQDILNAFRERFGEHEVLCGLEEYPHAKCSCEYPEIIKWLLTTLTEFEREIIAKVDNIMDEEKAKDMGDQMEAFTGQRSCKMCGFNPEHQRKYILSQLEKEKHPSK